jgi:putative aminopeptidase FrvX
MKKWLASGLLFAISCHAVGANKAMDADLQNIAQLSEIAAISGFEKPVRLWLKEHWQPYTRDFKSDGMGNIITGHSNNQQGPRLLLMSHMDEVGLMVDSITDDGFIRVQAIGGIYGPVTFAQRWHIQTPSGVVTGYSGFDAPHLLKDDYKTKTPDFSQLFIDIGATSKQQAEQQFGIRPGLAIAPASKFTKLSDRRYLAKALDDRIGLDAITDTLKNVSPRHQPNQLFAAATVQEEVGMRGASTIYASTQADVAINVEIGLADDYPEVSAKRKNHIKLGAGPTLFVYDRSMIPNQALVEWVIALARKNNIPLQLELESGYGEDGARIQTSGKGVPVINLGIPMRYAHQQAGVFDIQDYRQLVKLLGLIVANFNQDVMLQLEKA